MKAVLCPVCEGEGELFHYTEVVRGKSGTKHMKACNGCRGSGWVNVPDGISDARRVELNTLWGYHTEPDECPGCHRKRSEPALIGCPFGGHYGSYCSV